MNTYELWFQKHVYVIVLFQMFFEGVHHNFLHILYTYVSVTQKLNECISKG